MNRSEDISLIIPALMNVQTKITFASMDRKNPHFGNSYATLKSVIDEIKPKLNENEILFMQLPTSPAPGDPITEKAIYLETIFLHKSGQWISSTFHMPLAKLTPQEVGSALTYARRYALTASLGIYQDDDDANIASGLRLSKDQVNELKDLFEPAQTTESVVLQKAGVKSLIDLTQEEFMKCKNWLLARIEKIESYKEEQDIARQNTEYIPE